MEDNNISITCSSEYKDYGYYAKHDIWTLVSLKAPCHEEEEDDRRASIDVVAVMDKSGSMAGKKLELVKRTLEFVLTQLSPKDRFSLVTYDSNVYVDVPLMKMNGSNKDTALDQIKAIKDGSSTNLCGGLMKGLCQIIDRIADEKNTVASVLLFTDGLANQGITNAAGIVGAMKDPKRFDGPAVVVKEKDLKKPFSKMRMKKSKVVTASPVAAEGSSQSGEHSEGMAADASVYTFGFGEDHDEQLLKQISDAGNGMYYFIETEDKIGESFAHCLGGLMTTVAQGIQLSITTEADVDIKDMHSARLFEKDGTRSVKINMGDLQSEENRDIALELTINALTEPLETQILLSASVDYFNVLSNTLERASGSLAVQRPEKEGDHSEESAQPRVTREKCRVTMTEAMKISNDKASSGDIEGAKSLLSKQISSIQKYRKGVADHHKDEDIVEEFDQMTSDLQELQSNVESASVWTKKGKKAQVNMLQEYECQRSSNVQSKAFATKGKAQRVMKSKAFFKES